MRAAKYSKPKPVMVSWEEMSESPQSNGASYPGVDREVGVSANAGSGEILVRPGQVAVVGDNDDKDIGASIGVGGICDSGVAWRKWDGAARGVGGVEHLAAFSA